MKTRRLLPAVVFGGLLSFGVVLFATEDHPSALFKEYCAKCHGEDGKADTPKGRQLMAQDMTDPEWQAEKTDADLIKVVTKGGEDMPPFGKKLTKEQIESLVKNDVRGFAPKKK
ncbi:MAG TPA: cytochrome c [Thermoanaerobaculia bacterium]|jgi:mono/diheme cytochrome c family protein|nr:cytochrome c [Thermoanaerobaculia bacterium]